MSSILQLLTFLCLISSIYAQCSKSSTSEQFYGVMDTITECKKDTMFVFRRASDLILSLYDDDDQIVGEIQQDILDMECRDLNACKVALLKKNCGSEINSVITLISSALCDGETAKTDDLNNALSQLKSSGCDVEEHSINAQPAGCHISEDENTFRTYLLERRRQARKVHARQRCLSRFYDAYGTCSDTSIMNNALLNAALDIPEYLEESYRNYTNYKPMYHGKRVTKSIFGLTQISDSTKSTVICYPREFDFAVWTTYFSVAITTRKLNPVDKPADIMMITISLSNNDGITMADYMADSDSDLVDTFRSEKPKVSMADKINGGENYVDIRSENGKIVIYHSAVDTTFIVFKSGTSLGLTMRSPQDLLESEGLGLMVEDCADLGGETIDDTEVARIVTGESLTNCTRMCSDNYKPKTQDQKLCLLTCHYEIHPTVYQDLYVAESLAVEEDNKPISAAESVTSSAVNILLTLLLSIHYLYN